jgi:hypothetical protein
MAVCRVGVTKVRQRVKKNKSTAWKILGQPVPISGKPQNRAHADLVGVPNPKSIAFGDLTITLIRVGSSGPDAMETIMSRLLTP